MHFTSFLVWANCTANAQAAFGRTRQKPYVSQTTTLLYFRLIILKKKLLSDGAPLLTNRDCNDNNNQRSCLEIYTLKFGDQKRMASEKF